MQPVDWGTFRAELLGYYCEPDFAAKTRTKVRQVFDELAPFVSTTADLTHATFDRWKARPSDRSAITHNSILSYARSICRHAVDRGYLDRSPLHGATKYRRKVPRRPVRRHLSRLEMARLLLHLERGHKESWEGGRLHALAMLISHTGLRAMEALRLRVEDVDLVAQQLHVVARSRLKTVQAEATIPIPPAAIACLREWRERCGSAWLFPGRRRAGPWVNGSSGKRPADYLDEAGIEAGLPPGTTLLMLRHSLATHARTSFGLGSKEVQQILRHADERTQDHYLATDMDNLRRAVRPIDLRIVG